MANVYLFWQGLTNFWCKLKFPVNYRQLFLKNINESFLANLYSNLNIQ